VSSGDDSDDHDASLATLSPKNSATTTTNRKLAEENSAKRVKFGPPAWARSVSVVA